MLQLSGDQVLAARSAGPQRSSNSDKAAVGFHGFGIADAQLLPLRGDKRKALGAWQRAAKAGWRDSFWRYPRDFDQNLASIRNEPEFKAVFADIERDMAQQRARLAARPKDAPLELTDASR